jgi:catechol 2,3-dioxygenase-like lactoylglutathione lyase family enzyme
MHGPRVERGRRHLTSCDLDAVSACHAGGRGAPNSGSLLVWIATTVGTGLVPFAHVASVKRSIGFYEMLGLDVRHSLASGEDGGDPCWAFLKCGDAELMVALATAPVVPSEQAVLFYLYTDDVVVLRDKLHAEGVAVSGIAHPGHMPGGEFRVEDPDGYTLLIGQLR